MGAVLDALANLWGDTGIANFTYQNGIMIVVSFVFLYLAIRHGFEPLLLVPIAFGMLLSNLPVSGMFIEHFEITSSNQLTDAGILTVFYALKPILPSLIFLGVGSMTDFGPLIANPKSLLMGAAAQLGIFFAFFAAIILGFNARCGSIFIYGSGACYTASYHEGSDHKEGKRDQDGAAEGCEPEGKDIVPDSGNCSGSTASAFGSASYRYADAGQSV